MSIDKLISLQPGNLLNLDIRPENGVMLVVNGKIFGQGELILIGDNVVVRIKEIGFKNQVS
jgi:flagellar motor switch protein FliN/FliY